MPTYQYACTACGEQSEFVQKFTDDPLTECLGCGGRLRKVFSAVGIVFKGTGFYRTDSRAAVKEGAGSKPNGAETGTKTAAGGSAGDSAPASSNGSSAAASPGAPSNGSAAGSGSPTGKSATKVA